MEQKETQKSKRALWSVYVFVERQVQVGRSMKRRKRLTDRQSYSQVSGPIETETTFHKFLYLNVSKMYKEGGMICIQQGVGKKKEIHRHELKEVSSIQVREYDRSGRIQ